MTLTRRTWLEHITGFERQWPNKNTVVSLNSKELAIQNFELVTPLHEFIKPWVSGVSINMKLISAVWCRCFSFATLVILHDLNHKNAWINHYHYYDRTLTKVGLCIMQTNDSKSLVSFRDSKKNFYDLTWTSAFDSTRLVTQQIWLVHTIGRKWDVCLYYYIVIIMSYCYS